MKKETEISKEQDKKTSKGDKLIVIIPAIMVFVGVIFTGIINLQIQKLKAEHEKEMWELENNVAQRFLNMTEVVERAGIIYIQYSLTSEPVLKGYHVIAYPYLKYETWEGNVYIPVTGQFTQGEYTANEQGYCPLFREDTTDELLDALAEKSFLCIEQGCLVAIQYVETEQEVREVYILRDGELIKADQELAVEVLDAWENMEEGGENRGIDIADWPYADWEYIMKLF